MTDGPPTPPPPPDETPQPPPVPVPPPRGPVPGARLLRSRSDRMIAGVCGGIAAYLGIDTTLVRIGAVVLGFVSGGTAVLAYFLGWILIPEGDTGHAPVHRYHSSEHARMIAGAVLVVLGGLWLVSAIVPGLFFHIHAFAPLLLIGVGVLLVVQAARR